MFSNDFCIVYLIFISLVSLFVKAHSGSGTVIINLWISLLFLISFWAFPSFDFHVVKAEVRHITGDARWKTWIWEQVKYHGEAEILLVSVHLALSIGDETYQILHVTSNLSAPLTSLLDFSSSYFNSQWCYSWCCIHSYIYSFQTETVSSFHLF